MAAANRGLWNRAFQYNHVLHGGGSGSALGRVAGILTLPGRYGAGPENTPAAILYPVSQNFLFRAVGAGLLPGGQVSLEINTLGRTLVSVQKH